MSSSVAEAQPLRHRELPETANRMARADLRKAENEEKWNESIGKAIERTRTLSGKSLKEFADAVGRDERQVARWISGGENPQLARIFRCAALRQSLVIALAELAEGVTIETTVTIRRIA